MKIDIVIPNYNGSHLVKKNLPGVLEAIEKFDSRIIIVDDGSKEEDLISLRGIVEDFSKKHKVKLIEHSTNLGFSSAVNTGVRNSKAGLVVLLNSDVLPRKDFLESPVQKISSDKDIFGIGCLDESIEDGKVVLRGNGSGKWKDGMVTHSEGNLKSEKTFWISGGSSVIDREKYIMLGGMDEIYNPFYWEDIDLSYRAQKAGFRILFDRNSVVRHYHEEGSIKKNVAKTKITTIAYRNQFIFVWKNVTDIKLIINHIVLLPANLLKGVRRGDFEFFKGFSLAIIKLPDIMKKRKLQKKFYKVSDKEIFKSF